MESRVPPAYGKAGAVVLRPRQRGWCEWSKNAAAEYETLALDASMVTRTVVGVLAECPDFKVSERAFSQEEGYESGVEGGEGFRFLDRDEELQ